MGHCHYLSECNEDEEEPAVKKLQLVSKANSWWDKAPNSWDSIHFTQVAICTFCTFTALHIVVIATGYLHDYIFLWRMFLSFFHIHVTGANNVFFTLSYWMCYYIAHLKWFSFQSIHSYRKVLESTFNDLLCNRTKEFTRYISTQEHDNAPKDYPSRDRLNID